MKKIDVIKAFNTPKATAMANAAQIGGVPAAGIATITASRKQRVKKKDPKGGLKHA